MVVGLLAWCPFIFKWVAGHDDVIQWKHFPRYWPFVRGIHRSPVDCPHKASGAELWCFFDLHLNKRLSKQSDLRRHDAHYDVTVMDLIIWVASPIAAGRHVPFIIVNFLSTELKLMNMLTLYELKFSDGTNIYIYFTFYVIPPHRHDTGYWHPSPSKTRTYLFYIVNIMGADVLVT